jgi:uncharacterized protein (TIGR02996 family)
MSEEAAFLQALETDPDDDVTRLVYADWLDERGDVRGRYLRLEIEASREVWNQDQQPGQVEELLALRTGFDPDWLVRAGKHWDLQLREFEAYRKINVIKVFRSVTSCGLKEAKVWCEAAPCCVLAGLDLAGVHAGVQQFQHPFLEGVRIEVHPTLRTAPGYEILLGWHFKEEEPVVRALLARFLARDPAQVVLPPRSPCSLRSGLSGREAFALRDEVQRVSCSPPSLYSRPDVILRRTG